MGIRGISQRGPVDRLKKSNPMYDIILKESIRFRADKENSSIQKIKLL